MKHCPECGSEVTEKDVDGRVRDCCENCDTVHYKNPSPCAGVIVRNGDSFLAVKRGLDPWKGT